MASALGAFFNRVVESVQHTLGVGLDVVSTSPLFSRKRRREVSSPPEHSRQPPTPPVQASPAGEARSAFAAQAATRTNAMPSVLRGERAAKRARGSPGWSNTPGFTSLLRPARENTLTPDQRRLSLANRTLRLSTDSLAQPPLPGVTPRTHGRPPISRRISSTPDTEFARQQRKSMQSGVGIRRHRFPHLAGKSIFDTGVGRGRVEKRVSTKAGDTSARKSLSDRWNSPIVASLAARVARERDGTPSKRPRSMTPRVSHTLRSAPVRYKQMRTPEVMKQRAVSDAAIPNLSAITPAPPPIRGAHGSVSEQRVSKMESNGVLGARGGHKDDLFDVSKIVGISREELCRLYTQGIVETMEASPIFAQKVLKKHAVDVATLLRQPLRRAERKKRIAAAESDLAKIRSSSRVYACSVSHQGQVHAALYGCGGDDVVVEAPPEDSAAHWNLCYWAVNDAEVETDLATDPIAKTELEERRSVIDESSAYAPLTPHALRRVQSVLGSHMTRNEQFANIGGCRVTGADLQMLKPKVWLNDEIVNSYFELLFRRSEAAPKGASAPRMPRIRCLSSFWYAKLYEKNRGRGCQVYDYSRVKRWTRKFNVFDYDIVLIPINQHNMHWTLGVLNMNERRVEHFDSFGGGGSDEILNNLLQWLMDEANTKGRGEEKNAWKMVSMAEHLPQQDNSDDCGVFVCKFAEFLASNRRINFRASHMRYFRSRIAHELLVQRVA